MLKIISGKLICDELIYPIFDVSNRIRLNYTVHRNYYPHLTCFGVQSYDLLYGKTIFHNGDDVVALKPDMNKHSKNTYRVLMPFHSMKCLGVVETITNTIVFEGVDEMKRSHQLRITHCIDQLVKKGDIVVRGQPIATVSDKGVFRETDNSHVHFTYKIDGQIRSLISILTRHEKFTEVYADKKNDLTMDSVMYLTINKVMQVGWYGIRDKAITGAFIYRAKLNDKFPLIEISNEKASDGFYWGRIELPNGKIGYIQLDWEYMDVILNQRIIKKSCLL